MFASAAATIIIPISGAFEFITGDLRQRPSFSFADPNGDIFEAMRLAGRRALILVHRSDIRFVMMKIGDRDLVGHVSGTVKAEYHKTKLALTFSFNDRWAAGLSGLLLEMSDPEISAIEEAVLTEIVMMAARAKGDGR